MLILTILDVSTAGTVESDVGVTDIGIETGAWCY